MEDNEEEDFDDHFPGNAEIGAFDDDIPMEEPEVDVAEVDPSDNLGTTTYGGPLTSSGTSTSPFHSHSLPAHCAVPGPDRRWDHLLLHLLRALPWEYRHRMHRIQHSRENGRQNLLLHCLPW